MIVGISLSVACGTKKDNDSAWRWWSLLPSVFGYWTLSWGIWLLLYGVKILGAVFNWAPPYMHATLQIISDVNSVCLFLVFYGLTRGNAISRQQFAIVSRVLFVCVLLFDIMLISLGCILSEGREPLLFQQQWSLAIAMFAMFLFGRAFMLRYRTNSVWILAIIYTLAQPLAYGAAFSLSAAESSISVTVPHAIEFPEDVQGFVREIHAPGGSATYHVLSTTDGYRPTLRQTRLLLKAINAHVEPLKYAQIFAQLRFADTIFAFLAVMKLAISATVFANLRVVPMGFTSVVRWSGKPVGPSLVDGWQRYYYIHIAAVPLLIGGAWFLLGRDVSFVLLAAVIVVGRGLWWTRGGRTIWHVLGRSDTE